MTPHCQDQYIDAVNPLRSCGQTALRVAAYRRGCESGCPGQLAPLRATNNALVPIRFISVRPLREASKGRLCA
jgi:hypothetical protein